MTEELFDILDELVEKQKKLDEVIEILGGSADFELLEDALDKTELAIIKSLGGHEGHYEHITSTDYFYNYRERKSQDAKEKLIDYIKKAIERNWTEEVSIIISQG